MEQLQERIEASEVSTVRGYKLLPLKLTEESTGITVTIRHLPMRVYLHCYTLAQAADENRGWSAIVRQAMLYAAFSVRAIEGLDEPPTWDDVEVDGIKYKRLSESTLDQLPPGFLLVLREEIEKYNCLTKEEKEKLNFTTA